MSVAFEVSRPDRSRDLSNEQPENMPVAVGGTATAPSIFAEIIQLLLPSQGAPSRHQFSSSPLCSPSSGAIVRQPLASIIQRAVPLVVQSTMGSPDSPDCRATPPSAPAPSAAPTWAESLRSPPRLLGPRLPRGHERAERHGQNAGQKRLRRPLCGLHGSFHDYSSSGSRFHVMGILPLREPTATFNNRQSPP